MSRTLAFLMSVGSRLLVGGEIVLLILLVQQCDREECAFGPGQCEEGGSGAGGGDGTPDVECDDGVCAEVFVGQCGVTYGCRPKDDPSFVGNKCFVWELTPGKDDHNACTHDACVDDVWQHTPFTAKEIDDGDPCTIDECTPVEGIQHTQSCG